MKLHSDTYGHGNYNRDQDTEHYTKPCRTYGIPLTFVDNIRSMAHDTRHMADERDVREP